MLGSLPVAGSAELGVHRHRDPSDTEYDRNGAYSGNALTDDGNLELFFLREISKKEAIDYINEGREQQ